MALVGTGMPGRPDIHSGRALGFETYRVLGGTWRTKSSKIWMALSRLLTMTGHRFDTAFTHDGRRERRERFLAILGATVTHLIRRWNFAFTCSGSVVDIGPVGS